MDQFIRFSCVLFFLSFLFVSNGASPCGNSCTSSQQCLRLNGTTSTYVCVANSTINCPCYGPQECVAVSNGSYYGACECKFGGSYGYCYYYDYCYDSSAGKTLYCDQNQKCLTYNNAAYCVNSSSCNCDGASTCQLSSSTTTYCRCDYSGTYPSCTGAQCGNSYCQYANQTCLQAKNKNFVCVDSNVYQSCYYSCYYYSNTKCWASTDGKNASCDCAYGGTFGNCAAPTICGMSYCNEGEVCVYQPNGYYNSYICYDNSTVQSKCSACTSSNVNPNAVSCVLPANNDTSQMACGCVNNYYSSNSSYPNCDSLICNGTYCKTTEYCLSGRDGVQRCVSYSDYRNCSNQCSYSYASCYSASGNKVQCECQYGNTLGNCYSTICGGSGCTFYQQCYTSISGGNISVCANYSDYNAVCNSCSTTTGAAYLCDVLADGTPTCICKYGGTYPNCGGQPCNGGYCNGSQYCLPNAIEGNPEICVDSNVYCYCNYYSTCAAISSTSTTCVCEYGGSYPNCNYPQYCGNGYCKKGEVCVNTEPYNNYYSSVCVSNASYIANCSQCLNGQVNPNIAMCVSRNKTGLGCECVYGSGTFPDQCSSGLCYGYANSNGSSFSLYCKADEYCMSNTFYNKSSCVKYSDYNSCYQNCSNGYSSCASDDSTGNVVCNCYYGGIAPNCNGVPCGSGYCKQSEQCLAGNNNQSYCVNSTEYYNCYYQCNYQDFYGECTARSDGTAYCKCLYGGTAPNCKGYPCGSYACNKSEQCLPNTVKGASSLCVPNNKVNCNQCYYSYSGSHLECKATLGTPQNFAECVCNLTDPITGNCKEDYCGNQDCSDSKAGCVNGTCKCVDPYTLGKLSGKCEVNPLLSTCVPCKSSSQTDCGCGAGAICELQNTTDTTGYCVCAPGYTTDFDNIVCIPLETPPSYSLVTCMAYGDPHYISFDKRSFDYQKKCDFVLTETSDRSFRVHVRNDECNPALPSTSVSCTKAVAFVTPSPVHVIEMTSTNLKINGVDNSTTYAVLSGVTIYKLGQGYRAQFPDGSIIELKATMLRVSVPQISKYMSGSRGLCGNFDFDATNDFMLRDGTIAQVVTTFGNDWQVKVNETLFTTTNSKCGSQWTTNNPYNFCENNPGFQDYASEYCSGYVYNAQQCDTYFDLLRAYSACLNDACLFGTNSTEWGIPMEYLCNLEENQRAPVNASCQPACNGTDQCLIVAGSSSPRCIKPAGCGTCGTNEVCQTVAVADGTSSSSCVCASGYRRSKTSGLCVSVSLCGDVYCNGTNEVCQSLEQSDGSFEYQCNCGGTTSRDLNGNCVDVTSPGIYQPCSVCLTSYQDDCGCADETLACTVKEDTDTMGSCLCASGYTYNETSMLCEPGFVYPVPTPSICSLFGDPHYTTFDSSYYHFQTQCDVIALQTKNLSVHVRQGDCWGGSPRYTAVACVKGFAVSYNNHKVEVNDDNGNWFNYNSPVDTYVDGTLVTSNTNVGGISVAISMGYVTVTLAGGLQITYQRAFSLTIYAPAFYYGHVTGTCGNFNGDSDDDDTTGIPYIIGQSPLFHNANAYCCANATCLSKRDVSGGSSDPNCQKKATEKCAVIKDLSKKYPNCTAVADLTSFYYACLYDYCALGDSIINSTISSADKTCNLKSQIYSQCGSASGGACTPSINTGTSSSTSTTGTVSGSVSGGTSGSTAAGSTSGSSGEVSEGHTTVVQYVVLLAALIATFMF